MSKSQSILSVEYLFKSVALVLLMWLVFWIEMRWHTDFTKYGILPRTASGLFGILTSPLIHSGFSHLWSNTVPVMVLLYFLSIFYKSISTKVLLYGWLLSGLLTWTIARESYHIGASGLVYVLASFIYFKGIFSGNYRQVAASLIVVFLYGSLVWYVLPIRPTMSWEGHLSGAVAGLLLAAFIRYQPKETAETVTVSKNEDPEMAWFMQQFDEDGNFRPVSIDEEE